MFSPVIVKGGFKFIEQYSIDVLGVKVHYYEHQKTGAIHYHFACDDNNKTFMVALRTLPMTSNGVAHILEHLALCGSSRYPVRDPFFLMIRRSLSNFMNAFTASDWTAYPFSTQNNKDFDNLLNVYLDAVFFPSLEESDFKQEGWRLHIESPGEEAEFQYKGVVFNEMKGALSSPNRQLWHHVCRHLFTHSTYHHNSGGEPLEIPLLTHQQLLDFHQCYYHPSNAVFFSYGNLDPAELQENIEKLVLYAFDKKEDIPVVTKDIRFSQPKNITEYYPITEQDNSNISHIVLAWLLDFNPLDIDDLLAANLLNLLLFDNASSPIQKLLEETNLGTSPSSINGLEDEMKEMVFVIGLEGCEDDAEEQVSELIMNELQRLKKEGIPLEQIQSCMHQLELAQRDVSGGSMPTGLNLLLSVITPAIHNEKIGTHLDIEAPLKRLKEKSEDSEYIKSLIARLCDTAHRICLKMSPDETLKSKMQQAEAAQLDAWKEKLSLAEQKQIQQDNETLEKRQLEPQNAEILPTIGVEDIKAECDFIEATERTERYSYYQTQCNGLVYVNGVMQLPEMTQQQSYSLPLLNAILSEVGTHKESYLAVQQNTSRYTGGISLKPHLWQPLASSNEEDLRLRMAISSMSLTENARSLLELMHNPLTAPRFDEHRHIKELINQLASSAFYSIASSGHLLAMQAASSHFSNFSNIGLEWSGLAAVNRLLSIKKSIKKDEYYAQLMADIQALFTLISEQWQAQWLLISDEKNKSSLIEAFSQQDKLQVASGQKNNHIASGGILTDNALAHEKTVWSIESEVNYCGSAYKAVSLTHEDSPALSILANYLRNVHLHTAIREQGGAYGGGCQYDSMGGTFRFFSYRDPRLHETYADFQRSIDKLGTEHIKSRDIQEAIFNAVSKIDAPSSPPDSVKQDFYASLKGIDKAFRESYKEKLLNITADDIRRVAKKYLADQKYSQAVITGHEQAEKLAGENFHHTPIKL